jgi:hypothetical protein
MARVSSLFLIVRISWWQRRLFLKRANIETRIVAAPASGFNALPIAEIVDQLANQILEPMRV